MNDAKFLYDGNINTLTIECDRSKESGIIHRHFLSINQGGYRVNNRVFEYEDDIYLLDSPKGKTVPYYGELALVDCYKSDYDPYVDFMFYARNGVVLVDKNLKLVYHSKNGKMFENKKDLIKLVCLYGASVLIYMNPTDYLDKKLQSHIKGAFKERIKMLREKGASVNLINLEKFQFEKVTQAIELQAKNDFENSY